MKTIVNAMGNMITKVSQIKGVNKVGAFIGSIIGAAIPPTGGGLLANTKLPNLVPSSVSSPFCLPV